MESIFLLNNFSWFYPYFEAHTKIITIIIKIGSNIWKEKNVIRPIALTKWVDGAKLGPNIDLAKVWLSGPNKM